MSSVAAMLPETEFRRDCFDEDHVSPIVLSDGQTWFLQRPFLTFQGTFKDGVPISVEQFFNYPRDIQAITDAIAASGEADPGTSIALTLALGAKILLLNYDLSPEELAKVLVFNGDETSFRILGDILSVAAFGQGLRLTTPAK